MTECKLSVFRIFQNMLKDDEMVNVVRQKAHKRLNKGTLHLQNVTYTAKRKLNTGQGRDKHEQDSGAQLILLPFSFRTFLKLRPK